VEAAFPHAPRPFLDLSTGINPDPYPFSPSPALFHRLPEPGSYAALEAAAARAYGVSDPRQVVAAPGSQLLIGLLPRLFSSPRTVAVLGPTYGEYRRVWERAGHRVREVAEDAALDGLAEDIVLLARPNNPTGRIAPAAALLELADRLAARGGLLIVDEAFADFTPGLSLAPLFPEAGLLLLRSFGKAFGLPGLRLGFAIAPRPLAAALRTVLGPWPVSGAAIAAGLAALTDTAWQEAARAWLAARQRETAQLFARAGFTLAGETPLFLFLHHPEAGRWWERLAAAGVVLRRFADLPAHLRAGLPPSSALPRLASALGLSRPVRAPILKGEETPPWT